MAETRWDIKRGASVYHNVSDARLKQWIRTGRIKAGEVAVWRINLSGWRRPEDLEELKATFKLRQKSAPRRKDRSAAAGKPAPGENRIGSILLVDDEKDLCALLGDSLSARGYRMEFAHTKRDALKSLKRRLPDLVLLDLRLPDGDGMALLSLIRKARPGAPVFITTAFGSEEIRSQALKMGARGFLDKPYDEEDVIRRIKAMSVERTAAGRGRG